MPRKPDIIFLETRKQRIKRRWQGMSRIGRLGIISIIFGLIGLITSWLFFVLQYLSVPFSMVGLVIGLVATILGFINNERWYGFWLPVVGLVVSGIGLAVAGINYSERVAWEREQERQNSPAMKLVGLWELSQSSVPTFLNFTDNGNVMLTQVFENENAATPSRGNQPISNLPATTRDRLAKYSVDVDQLQFQFRRGRSFSTCEFQFHLADDSRLVVDNASDTCSQFDIQGTWRLISGKETQAEKQQVDSKLAEYQSKLENLRGQRATLQRSMERLNGDRTQVLTQLEPYETGDRAQDDAWQVHARELKILVDQIDVVESRIPKLDTAILKLESAIRNRIREKEMAKLGLTDERLEELLRIKIQIEDELATAAEAGPVEEFALRDLIDKEFKRDDASETPTRIKTGILLNPS